MLRDENGAFILLWVSNCPKEINVFNFVPEACDNDIMVLEAISLLHWINK